MAGSRPRLMTLKYLVRLLSIPKSTIYDWIDRGIFPKPIKIGPRSVRWTREQIDDWIEYRCFISSIKPNCEE